MINVTTMTSPAHDLPIMPNLRQPWLAPVLCQCCKSGCDLHCERKLHDVFITVTLPMNVVCGTMQRIATITHSLTLVHAALLPA
jgi:hypothetical protein